MLLRVKRLGKIFNYSSIKENKQDNFKECLKTTSQVKISPFEYMYHLTLRTSYLASLKNFKKRLV